MALTRTRVVAATGSRILEGLEAEATRRDAQKLVSNSRDNAAEFYAKNGVRGGW